MNANPSTAAIGCVLASMRESHRHSLSGEIRDAGLLPGLSARTSTAAT